MGEEVKMSEYDNDDDGVEERILDWESGLPSADDLTPLSQPLIPPELASAFSISPVAFRTAVEVNQASQDTLSSLRGNTKHQSHNSAEEEGGDEDADDGDNGSGSGSESRKTRRIETDETAEEARTSSASAMVKRPRLVWTPQLHKRFVDVVGHLGIKNAVPKTIMQLMNVEGLTRENVASHLQKYRLYLKRMQGLSPSSDSASPSDHGLFESSVANVNSVPPIMGMPPPIPPPNGHHHHQQQQQLAYHHHHYSMMQQQHHHHYASLMNYHHMTPSDN